jgi:hypothetical protein
MHWLIWICTLVLLALWSVAGWGLHALLGLPPSLLDELSGALDTMPGADLLDRWWPEWRVLAVFAAAGAKLFLELVGAHAPWLATAVWGAGAVLLLGSAAAASGWVLLMQRESARSALPPPAAPRG